MTRPDFLVHEERDDAYSADDEGDKNVRRVPWEAETTPGHRDEYGDGATHNDEDTTVDRCDALA